MRIRRFGAAVLAGLAVLAMPAAATAPERIGTGWSRASNLSIYGAMNQFGAIAREQSVLCGNRAPAEVDWRWQQRYGPLHAWVDAAMVARYGPAAVARAQLAPGRPVPCEAIVSERWWRDYERLLRLLALRLTDGAAR